MQNNLELTEQERVALEVIEVLEGASFEQIKAIIRAQFRRELRPTLFGLTDRGLLLRFSRGQYALTSRGRIALRHERQELAA